MNLCKALPQDILHSDASPDKVSGEADVYLEYLLSPQGMQNASVRRYVGYMKRMIEHGHAVQEMFDLMSPPESYGTKKFLRHIGVKEILYIVHHLYVLDSFDVQGDVLECGVYQGFSTCILSEACRMLNRKLIAADSFCGLPKTRKDQPCFQEGDYAAGLDAVVENVNNYGDRSSVHYIKGFYKESLNDVSHRLCIIWLDVDLYESAKDVMDRCLPKLTSEGVIFTHEFTDSNNRPFSPEALWPPRAISEALEFSNRLASSVHLMKYFGAFIQINTIQPEALLWMDALYEKLRGLDTRMRMYDELNNCRTVKTAFKIKKLFSR